MASMVCGNPSSHGGSVVAVLSVVCDPSIRDNSIAPSGGIFRVGNSRGWSTELETLKLPHRDFAADICSCRCSPRMISSLDSCSWLARLVWKMFRFIRFCLSTHWPFQIGRREGARGDSRAQGAACAADECCESKSVFTALGASLLLQFAEINLMEAAAKDPNVETLKAE